MASEDLNVITDSKVKMSNFDPKNRVLSLPVLNDNTGVTYEGFVTREVGKARFSPTDDLTNVRNMLEDQHEGSGQIIDILEQQRTKNLVSAKFPGSISVSSQFNREMWEKDMYGVRGQNIDELHFMDRLNLNSEVGHIVSPKFSDEEQSFVDRANDVKTFDDCANLASEIVQYLYEEPPEQPQSEEPEDNNDDSDESQNEDGSGDGQGSGNGDSNDGGDGEGDNQEGSNDGQSGGSGGEPTNDDSEQDQPIDSEPQSANGSRGSDMPPMQTMQNFNDNFANSEVDTDAEDVYTLFIGEPKDSKSMVVDHAVILEEWKNDYKRYQRNDNFNLDELVKKFKRDQKNTVQYMAQEFERKKQASQFNSGKIANTGKLNLRKLHQYKTDENIFKSDMIVTDGKAHGMFMIMDMSGSMSGSRLSATIKQTLLMCLFCKSINIPFKVYGFTTCHYGSRTGAKMNGVDDTLPLFDFGTESTNLREYISSEMSSKDYDFAFKCLVRESAIHAGNGGQTLESLGGTPTLEAMNLMTVEMNKFKAKYEIQVLNTIILTDGDCCGPSWRNADIGYYSSLGDKSIITDVTTNTNYMYGDYRCENEDRDYITTSKIFYQMIKDRTECNLVYVFIGNLSDVQYKLSHLGYEDQLSDELKNKRSVSVPYHKSLDKYILSCDDDILVGHNNQSVTATTDVAAVFADNLKKKRNSKILANLLLDCIVKRL